MRRSLFLLMASALIMALASGCGTTQSITSKITGGVDENVYAQVPAEERGEVMKAEENLEEADAKLKLADLKLELAGKEEKLAKAEKKLAKNFQEEARAKVELAKWETIDKAGLGAKDKNIDAIASTKKDILSIQGDRYTIEAEIKKLKREIEELKELIGEQEGLLDKLKAAVTS